MAGKTTYHSALVKDSRDDPVEITLCCAEPLRSKFKDQPDYFSIKYDGEDRFYPVENDAIADTLSGYKGKTLLVTATGSRDDAEIVIEGDGDTHERRPAGRQQERRQPAREERQPAARQERRPHNDARGAEPPHRPSKEERAALENLEFIKLKVKGARIAVAMRASLMHAERIAEEVFGRASDGAPCFSSEDVRAIGLCHFIEIKGTTDFEKLPTKWIEPGAPAAKPSPARRSPEPEPEPEQEPAPPDYDPNDLASEDCPF